MMHDETKLPRWVREELRALRRDLAETIEELERTRAAHAVLFGRRGWFTVPGPSSGDDFDVRRLFWLSSEGAFPACSLYRNDVLLVGRRNPVPSTHDQEAEPE